MVKMSRNNKVPLYLQVGRSIICRVCGKVVYYAGRGRDSHAKKHIREGKAYSKFIHGAMGVSGHIEYYVKEGIETLDEWTINLTKMAIEERV